MRNWWRALAAAGLSVLLVAASEAPFGAEVGRWLAGGTPSETLDPAAEVPPFVEDPAIAEAALVEAPEVRIAPESLAELFRLTGRDIADYVDLMPVTP
ncbi:MAG: hypothetical protein ACK4MT_09280, partial [Thermaurantiacus tibetensis]